MHKKVNFIGRYILSHGKCTQTIVILGFWCGAFSCVNLTTYEINETLQFQNWLTKVTFCLKILARNHTCELKSTCGAFQFDCEITNMMSDQIELHCFTYQYSVNTSYLPFPSEIPVHLYKHTNNETVIKPSYTWNC